jgi:hypothetical protein
MNLTNLLTDLKAAKKRMKNSIPNECGRIGNCEYVARAIANEEITEVDGKNYAMCICYSRNHAGCELNQPRQAN